MTTNLSRRRCLAGIAVATTTLSRCLGQSPVTDSWPSIAEKVATPTSSLPVRSRVIRLRDQAGRAVVVTAVAIDPQGRYVAAAGDDHRIHIIATSDLSTIQTLRGHQDLIRSIAVSEDGDLLASAGNDGQVILCERDGAFRILRRIPIGPALSCVQFAPGGETLAAVGFDNEIFIVGRKDRSKSMLECQCQDLRTIAYRDDNRMLAAAGRSGDLYLFDPSDGRLLDHPRLHRGRIHAVTFHRQSNVAVSVGDDGAVTVYDTENRSIVRRIRVTTGKLFAAVAINSHAVAVAGSDNRIRIVNTDDGTVTRELEAHAGSVSTLASGSGWLFSGSFDATLRRWSIDDFEPSQQRIAEIDPRIDR